MRGSASARALQLESALDGYRIAVIVGTGLFVAALLVIVILVKSDDSDSEPLEPERRPDREPVHA